MAGSRLIVEVDSREHHEAPQATMPVMAELHVRDVPESRRFEITLDGELAGFAAYARRPGLIDFLHTEIDPRFEGRGVGSTLIAAALDAARAEGLDVIPHCPFVRAYLQRHPELVDLVPAARRAAFGLGAP